MKRRACYFYACLCFEALALAKGSIAGDAKYAFRIERTMSRASNINVDFSFIDASAQPRATAKSMELTAGGCGVTRGVSRPFYGWS